jgi:hypothetical protein
MKGFVTYCFSDWTKETFQRGVLRIRNGKKTDEPIRRLLRIDEIPEQDYYIKKDPNFDDGTYSRCHCGLRKAIQPRDVLFFRTLWRGNQYLIGYFSVLRKSGEEESPIVHADMKQSRLIDFALLITFEIAQLINPEIGYRPGVHKNVTLNGRLGRNYKLIDEPTTKALVALIDAKAT